MAEEEEDDAMGIPEWVVTFGDMMSLLLTFFIMLVSLSEMKEEETYQAMVQSMQQNFGYDMSNASITPGDSKPRNSRMAQLATSGRAKRRDTMKGGAKPKSASGENERVLSVRAGGKTGIGAVVQFKDRNTVLTASARKTLDELCILIDGKPQKIDVRGHTSRLPPADGTNRWSVAFERANIVRQYVVDKGIKVHRVRISVAGPHEPLEINGGATEELANDRVEIYMLDETSEATMGKPGELDGRLIKE